MWTFRPGLSIGPHFPATLGKVEHSGLEGEINDRKREYDFGYESPSGARYERVDKTVLGPL